VRPHFTDESFHNTGVGAEGGVARPGRFGVTKEEADRGKFKTPTLRGLVETAPYMHDGSLATLEDVVAFYRKGGHANPDLDPAIRPLDLTDAEAANLVAFLKALSRRGAPADATR
jgi:cytochrome c peroxidase